jgi:putative copper resistance protein D
VVDWTVIAIRFALYFCLTLLFGLPLFRWHALGGADRAEVPGKAAASKTLLLATAAFALATAGIWLNAARMAGMPIMALDLRTVEMIVTQTPIGTAWQVQLFSLVIAVLAALWSLRSRKVWTALLLSPAAGTALASLAWTGHGASGDGIPGAVHLIADVVHLLAVGIWLGALAGFIGLLFVKPATLPRRHLTITAHALQRFSITGSIAVAAILLSGLVNSIMLMDITHPGAIIGSFYGQLLIAKLALFLGMLVFAAANRFRLTPAFAQAIVSGDTGVALAALRRSLALESGTAIAILALVAWLGTLEPPASLG